MIVERLRRTRGEKREETMRRWLGTLGLYALGAAFLAAGIFGIAQTTVLSDVGEAPTERAIKPVGAEKTLPKPIEESPTPTRRTRKRQIRSPKWRRKSSSRSRRP
jgi:hypothetical protein